MGTNGSSPRRKLTSLEGGLGAKAVVLFGVFRFDDLQVHL